VASANLDLTRSIFTAFERGDWWSGEWAHPEIEFVIAEGPSPGTSQKLAGMARAWREWMSAWDDLRVKVEEYRQLDDDRILVRAKYSERGKTSGLELGQVYAKTASLFHFRDSKVIKLVCEPG
jgi:hypothetical protein